MSEIGITKRIPKFNIVGNERNEFISYTRTIGITDNIQSDSSDYIIITDEKLSLEVNFDGKYVVIPYNKNFDKTKINCKKLMTYAVEENGADAVAKNVRFKSDFTAFELLSDYGIGRVYIDGTEKNYPKYALAFACGIMLSGIGFRTAVDIVSSK